MPLVVRLDGTNSEEGLGLLADADLPNLHLEKTMLGAADKVVELAKAEAGMMRSSSTRTQSSSSPA